jgi:hypothetical protein
MERLYIPPMNAPTDLEPRMALMRADETGTWIRGNP